MIKISKKVVIEQSLKIRFSITRTLLICKNVLSSLHVFCFLSNWKIYC